MTRRIRLGDIAQRAGVHPSTVSRVLGGQPTDLSPATGQRVRQAATDLGWFDPVPTAPVDRRPSIVMASRIDTHWHDTACCTLLDCLAEAAGRQGHDLVIVPLDEPEDWARRAVASVASGGVVLHHSLADWIPLAQLTSPSVLFDWPSPATGGMVDALVVDEDAALVALAGRLLGLGHRQACHVAPPNGRHQGRSQRRFATLHRVWSAGGGTLRPIEPGVTSVAAALRAEPAATALLFDAMADLGPVLPWLPTAGIRVPTDVSIACCDTSGMHALLGRKPAALVTPIYDMAYAAMDLVLRRQHQGNAPAVVRRFAVVLEPGGTLGPARP